MRINKKLAKVLIIFLLFSIITMPLVQAVGSLNPNSYNPSTKPNDTNTIFQIGGKLWGALSTVGVVVSVISLAIIGLRSTFGSLEDKAAYKKAMMPYIVGLCLVAGISTVINVVYNFADEVNSSRTVSVSSPGSKCPYCGDTLSRREINNCHCSNCDGSI